MHAPNPMQQFQLWRDKGGPGGGSFHLFQWNELTGERRAAYINHMTIGSLAFLGFLVAFAVMAFAGVVAARAYIGLFAAYVAIVVVHGIIMLARRETFWRLKWRERQAVQGQSQTNLSELMDYADKVRKGYVK